MYVNKKGKLVLCKLRSVVTKIGVNKKNLLLIIIAQCISNSEKLLPLLFIDN